MIATCRSNTGETLTDAWLEPAVNLDHRTELPLTVGRAYVVYAVALQNGKLWFYVADDNGLYYPMRYAAPLFEITDDRVPSAWHFRMTPGHLDHDALFAIEEWVADRFFYDRLTDGNTAEVRLFASARKRLDAEAGLVCE